MYTTLFDQKLNKIGRDDNFELRLAAIEENSGHLITMATIEWGKRIVLQYDCSKEMHSRLKLNELNSYCEFKHS